MYMVFIQMYVNKHWTILNKWFCPRLAFASWQPTVCCGPPLPHDNHIHVILMPSCMSICASVLTGCGCMAFGDVPVASAAYPQSWCRLGKTSHQEGKDFRRRMSCCLFSMLQLSKGSRGPGTFIFPQMPKALSSNCWACWAQYDLAIISH